MFIQAFDGSQYCCVNDKDIYALEEIPEHETKSKDLDIDYTPPKPKKPRIPPMIPPLASSTVWKICQTARTPPE